MQMMRNCLCLFIVVVLLILPVNTLMASPPLDAPVAAVALSSAPEPWVSKRYGRFEVVFRSDISRTSGEVHVVHQAGGNTERWTFTDRFFRDFQRMTQWFPAHKLPLLSEPEQREAEAMFDARDIAGIEWLIDKGFFEEMRSVVLAGLESATGSEPNRSGIDPCSEGARGTTFAVYGIGVIGCAVGCAATLGLGCLVCGAGAFGGALLLAEADYLCDSGGSPPIDTCPEPWILAGPGFCEIVAPGQVCCCRLKPPYYDVWQCATFGDDE